MGLGDDRHGAEEDEPDITLETHSLTPMSSNSALRPGSMSTPSVTPLGDLLTPSTVTPRPVKEKKSDEHLRDSTIEVDLGDIDESRFSTVALNIGNSRRSSATSRSDSGDRRSSTASFLLAKAQNTQFRHSLDGHRELQDEFEKAHANEDDTDGVTRGVDWGAFPCFPSCNTCGSSMARRILGCRHDRLPSICDGKPRDACQSHRGWNTTRATRDGMADDCSFEGPRNGEVVPYVDQGDEPPRQGYHEGSRKNIPPPYLFHGCRRAWSRESV